MRFLALIARTVVGSLFVVSGLIKANDSLGFSYKLEKYFAENVFDLPFLMDYALPLAFIIALVEVVVGFGTLLGSRSERFRRLRPTDPILLLMVLFFTWLTFYSAYYGVVKDCGCFGEALKLTPWESFSKNVVLLILVVIILADRRKISPYEERKDLIILPFSLLLIGLFSVGVLGWWFPVVFSLLVFAVAVLIRKVLEKKAITEWTLLAVYLLFTSLFSFFTLHYLPIKDFRPYAKGKSIPDQMSVPPDEQPVYQSTFIYQHKKSGKKKSIPQDSLGAYDLDEWKYVERSTRLVKEGRTPPIEDFNFENQAGTKDVTHKLIGDTAKDNRTGYVFLVVAYDLYHTDTSAYDKLNTLRKKAEKNGHSFYGATGSSGDKPFEFRQKHQIMYPFFSADKILLKTIIRSNPGLVLIKDGNVLAKWPSTDLPRFEEVKKKHIEGKAV
ncbi:MAG: DoxX family protein [Flavobacteriales bacterium]